MLFRKFCHFLLALANNRPFFILDKKPPIAKLQNVISTGRTDLSANNKLYLDCKNLYRTAMDSFPELTTSKLTLRKITPGDIPSLLKYCNNKNVSDQIINMPFPYLEEDAVFRMNFVLQGFKNKERYVFAVSPRDTGELIGEIGLHLDKGNNSAQFGYWIAESFWGKGFATEALRAILKFGFVILHLNKIYATHYPDNLASAKVMLNNGMIKEAEMKEHYKIDGVYKDVIQYRLTKKEYEALSRSDIG